MPATGVFSLLWLLIALPLAGAAILLFSGRKTNKWGPYLGVFTVFVDAIIAIWMLIAMMGNSAEQRTFSQNEFSWMFAGNLKVDMAFQLDQLSMVFVLLITVVGTLIHIYSLGYMSHDPDKRKFFGYLNLFVAAMLLLVLANNYLLLYVGWEGVGLASFLLISFWQIKPTAAAAGKKAFIINRVGDVGLSLAIMVMFVTFGSVGFDEVFGSTSQASEGTLTAIGLLLLLAAAGKSAQFPLQAWLLDAMEGPTPVSALIHAATMVTAGVYLITRSNAIFDAAAWAATAVVVVGVITMFMGAIIGSAKDDIKKSLAGSTMSQIGYMVLAAGLGPVGYVFAIFHLLTHGVFKAGLFLGAGSVMHGMNDNVNMRRYGALRTAMMVTYATFIIGTLSIMGIPPFSGFWSKDSIIHAAFESNTLVGILTIIAAAITGFYMTRMAAMTFFGKARWEDGVHPHESPKVMTIPLIILAIGSTFMGIALLFWGNIETWLEPVTGFEEKHIAIPEWALITITLILVLAGAAYGWIQYARREVPLVAPRGNWLTRAARQDLYGDAVNNTLVVQPSFWLSRFLVWFDGSWIDGFVNGSAAFFGGLSARLRPYQSGFIRSYALSMVGGAVLVVLALVLVRLS
ncbi:MAG: NADH-quinone oxidoreductase subunit L [Actinobacteria bacterium]|nr:NADH-quinone oxidoreductase subunit L [Actinomycetota bacterium]MSZ40738.1 NADH-quinone oxidoreductase subunit L [Actinomycetota bacterium]